jgi:hypothetical protein
VFYQANCRGTLYTVDEKEALVAVFYIVEPTEGRRERALLAIQRSQEARDRIATALATTNDPERRADYAALLLEA